MHYVSQYNYFRSLDRLARLGDEKPDLSHAVAGLSRFSLRGVFNNQELITIFQHKATLELIKRWASLEAKLDITEIQRDLRRSERYFVSRYVMKVNTPRYHSTLDCEFLRASFDNFETPPEIAELGPDKVSEFQSFCDEEWPHYKDKPIDIFWAHVGSAFGTPINPKQISYAPKEGPETVQSVSEDELMKEIHESAEELRSHARTTGLNGHLYAPPSKLYSLANDPDLDEARRKALLKLLKLKKAIKMLVFNFHRVELEMPEGLLSDELLQALGFLPCTACCGKRSLRRTPTSRTLEDNSGSGDRLQRKNAEYSSGAGEGSHSREGNSQLSSPLNKVAGIVDEEAFQAALDFIVGLERLVGADGEPESYDELCEKYRMQLDMAESSIRAFGLQIQPRTLENMQEVYYSFTNLAKNRQSHTQISAIAATINSSWHGIGPWRH